MYDSAFPESYINGVPPGNLKEKERYWNDDVFQHAENLRVGVTSLKLISSYYLPELRRIVAGFPSVNKLDLKLVQNAYNPVNLPVSELCTIIEGLNGWNLTTGSFCLDKMCPPNVEGVLETWTSLASKYFHL